MRIKFVFIVSVLLAAILLIGVSASAIITNVYIDGASRQSELAHKIASTANEMSYLSNDFLMYHENQQLTRWQFTYDEFVRQVASLQAYKPEQQTPIRNVQASSQRIKEVFDSIVSAVTSSSLGQGAIDPAFLQVSWSRMAVQSQSLIAEAIHLAKLYDTHVNQLRLANLIAVYGTMGIFTAYILINYLLLQRRILKSIGKLHAGTEIIGAGNLDFKVEVKENDEIGDLSRAFNRMTSSLKEVTASKMDMEKEIAERKKAEAASAHLASFPELNPDPVLELDASGNITYVNPSAKNAFPDLMSKGGEHPILAGIVHLPIGNEPNTVTMDINVYDSWYEQTITFVQSSQSYRIYARDITARKKAEDELRQRTTELEISNKELESFSYTVSHDLRAPLRSMDGFSQALLEEYADKLDEQGKDWLQRIRNSSQRMAQLIDDILGLSRIVRTELKFEWVNLSEIANSITERLKESEPARDMEFDIAPDIKVWGDTGLLRLVLENLIGNAFKFTARSKFARIEFGTSQEKGKTIFYVRDNGAGFDMKYANKLFKPFQRLHSAKDYSGTGIGLVTVERIIKRHGGEIWAESNEGKGATFYFTLG